VRLGRVRAEASTDSKTGPIYEIDEIGIVVCQQFLKIRGLEDEHSLL